MDTITNQDLITRIQTSVAILARGASADDSLDFDGAKTTAVRWAVKENRKELQDCLETYREMVAEKAEKYDVEKETALEAAVKLVDENEIDVGDALAQELEEVLDQEPPFRPYYVNESEIKEEPSIPLPVLELIDWMVVEDKQDQ